MVNDYEKVGGFTSPADIADFIDSDNQLPDLIQCYYTGEVSNFYLLKTKSLQHTFDAEYDQELRAKMAEYKNQMEQYKQQISMVGYKMTKFLYAN